tara:strand:+ start:76 stop:1197 length:1122 start_codon:yes stop_codon:yes gene_type:complete
MATGNFLLDLFGENDFFTKTNQFKNFLDKNNQIPFLCFDGENNYEETLFVYNSKGEKLFFKNIYEELSYKLNRGPFLYSSDMVVNYGFSTFIIFVQDGWILEDPYKKDGSIVLYPWDLWNKVLYTKHKDLDAPIILLAEPTDSQVLELSISPKLDFDTNVVVSPNEMGGMVAKYTDELEIQIRIFYSILKRYWKFVDRKKDIIEIPINMLFLINNIDKFFYNKLKKENEMSDRFNLEGGMDWVDCSIYLMFAQAHMTDWDLTENEIKVITEKAEIYVSHLAGEGMPYSDLDIKKKMKKAFNNYNKSLEGSDEELLADVRKISEFLKNQEWFNPTFAQSLVDMLGDISKADNVNENEKGNLRNLAEFWGVKSPI